ncbi:MAG: Tfp pilus assembly protein PilF [Polyangiales bacterium]|jgi:Tfp pilus assembly protein PilF
MKPGAIAIGAVAAGAITWGVFNFAEQPDTETETVDTSSESPDETPAPDEAPIPTEPPPIQSEDAASTIQHVEEQAAFFRHRFEEHGNYIDMARVAGHERTLARLTGQFEHYGEADDAIRAAFEAAGEGAAGPIETAAQLDFTMHRFPQVDAHIARHAEGVPMPARVEFQENMRANLAFARGDYATATTAFEAKLEERRSSANLILVAALRAQTGHPDEADALFVEAMQNVHTDRAFQRATLELQRGLLDLEHERYAQAKAHYDRANESFQSWYLVEEHLAEILCLLDRCDEAEEIYIDVISRTQSPELMASYGGILEGMGREDEAEEWRALADARYAVLLERFPEALGGHGLEYFLERGPPERALELAEANAELRQDGEALTLLAQAQLQSGQTAEALATLRSLLETPYRTPGFYEVAAEVFEANGLTAEAAEQTAGRAALMSMFATATDAPSIPD